METFQQEFQQENALTVNTVKNVPCDERLSSSEMSQLWLGYQTVSSRKCILQYLIAKAQDPEIKSLFTDTLNEVNWQLSTATDIFNSVGFPIPHGFTDEDVEPNAQRLYSDSLMLTYYNMFTRLRFSLVAYAIPLTTRPDVREFFNSALVHEQNFFNKSEDLLNKKGINAKPPYTPVPEKVNYIENQTWYGDLFGGKRSINVLELTHVFQRLETKLIESAIHLGFTRVVKDPKIKAYLLKGLDVLDKEIKRWSTILHKENLILPRSWRNEVTNSVESPFSDKLILFQTLLSVTYSVSVNGFALANCNRKDLLAAFTEAEIELASYGKDGLDLMIAHGWMEEIPLVADRNEIIGLHH
jgi:hypothetical protein